MKRVVFVILVFAMCVRGISTTVFAQRDVSREEVLASELKELGLFRGVSETDFDLDREPTRVEALVMLIRVLGKESEVTDGTWKHPFTDVPGWADNYVGYAYSKGITNGQSDTLFGTGNANAATYLTFVLRALGYSDENGKDFAWNDPFTLSKETGILADGVNINEFWRADVVLVSHAALSSYLKGSNQTLAQKLISAAVFTQSEYNTVYNKGATVTKPVQSGELTAEEIFEKCSPAVFYIELYDKNDEAISSGSGFFIDDKGTAVTNYHVIEDAYSALIQLSDTEAVHEVLGVYDYNAEEDWAIIKIDCSGNKYLNIGDSSSAVGGAKVYAIGSPLGLQNTISEGIISNPARVDGGVTYIQTNAAISHGSSGGALINKDGKVIGITTAGFDEGQNLNLALPIKYLEGYKLNQVIDFGTLFYSANGTAQNQPQQANVAGRKKMAFSALKQFVLKNYNRTNEILGYGYCESSDGGEYTWGLFYNSKTDELTATLVAERALEEYKLGFFYYVYFYEDEKCDWSAFDANIMYYDENEWEDWKEGVAEIDANSFCKRAPFGFYQYEGEGKEASEELANTFHVTCLNFINNLLVKYIESDTSYSIGDLGYINYQTFLNANISYSLSTNNLVINEGDAEVVEFNYEAIGFPENTTFYVESTNMDVADVVWDSEDDILPWKIYVEGLSAGTSFLKVSNDFNDQYITIPITVKSVSKNQQAFTALKNYIIDNSTYKDKNIG